MTNKDNAIGLKPIVVESIWGSIAAFFLMQILGLIVFKSFVFYLNDFFFFVVGGVWIIIFLLFQAETISKIQEFVFRKKFATVFSSLKEKMELFKMFAAIIFSLMFLYLVFVNYPFPDPKTEILHEGLFLVFSWIVSNQAYKFRKKGIETKVNMSTHAIIAGLVFGTVFLVTSFVFPTIFYFHGMIGIGAIILTLTAVLLRK